MLLVTGGAGFIGSHTLVELAQAGYQLLVLDNLCNSQAQVLARVEQLTGQSIKFIQGDIRDAALLEQIFSQHSIQAVVHFAGLKAVGESTEDPLSYYSNNVYGSQVLLQAMQQAGVFKLVFSSSATVYGEPAEIPITENCPLARPTNPYGRTKLIVEDLTRDLAASNPNWRIALLRYFNPIGAHASGLLGENPKGVPNNLLPYVAKVAVDELAELAVFGQDYPTPDGTGVRDYIHVVDLAQGHVAALKYLDQHAGVHTWNLGTGQGYSVLEIIHAFEQVSGQKIPYKVSPRRAGDLATCYSNPSKAKQELGWQAQFNLEQMLQDSWKFIQSSTK